MMSLNVIKSTKDAVKYFEQADYYTRDESPCEWSGTLAKSYNLIGEVTPEQLGLVLDGKPGILVNNFKDCVLKKKNRSPGTDLTFSAPKSVSIMALVYSNVDVIKAHETAVEKTLNYIERNLIKSRITENKKTRYINTFKMIAAKFRHDTSRNLDPQLHTHCLIANLTKYNGKVRAIDHHVFFDRQKELSRIYDNELALELKKVGFEIEKTGNSFEIKGIPVETREAFSTRRQEILTYMKKHGLVGQDGAEKANLATRNRKIYVQNPSILIQDWKEYADILENKFGLNVKQNNPKKQNFQDSTKDQNNPKTTDQNMNKQTGNKLEITNERDIETSINDTSNINKSDQAASLKAETLSKNNQQENNQFDKDKISKENTQKDTSNVVDRNIAQKNNSSDMSENIVFASKNNINAVDSRISNQDSPKHFESNQSPTPKKTKTNNLENPNKNAQLVKEYIKENETSSNDYIAESIECYASNPIQPEYSSSESEQLDDNKREDVKGLNIKVENSIDARYVPETSIALAIDHLAQYQTSFTRSTLIQTATRLFVGTHSIDAIEEAINKLVKHKTLIKSINEKNGDIVYTSKNELYREKEILQIIKKAHVKSSITNANNVKVAIGAFHSDKNNKFKLSDDQQKALLRIMACPNKYQAVQGYAGTGKTTVMSMVRELAEQYDYATKGFAPTNGAASQLEKETGIKSQTLDSLILDHNNSKQENNNGKQLWIVDESSMTSNVKLLEFLKISEMHDVKVLLLGDITQLSAIEAGKPFELLQQHGIYLSTIDTIQRQKTTILKQAVKDIIANKPIKALNDLNKHGMVYDKKSKDNALDGIAKEYLSMDGKERDKTLVIVGSNNNRHELNDLIRKGLQQNGIIRNDEFTVEIALNKNMSKAMAKLADSFEKGDLIRFGRRIKSLDIEKGQYAYVDEINKKTNQIHLAIKDEHGEEIRKLAINPKKYASITAYNPENKPFAIGDKIRITQSSIKDHGLNGGQEMIIIEINKDKIVATDGHRQKHELDIHKWKHIDYAYVSTAYSSQGKSYNNVLAYIDGFNKFLTHQKSFYVFVSRVKNNLKIFTNNKSKLLERVVEKEIKNSAHGVLKGLSNESEVKNNSAINRKNPVIKKSKTYLMDLIKQMHDKFKNKERKQDHIR